MEDDTYWIKIAFPIIMIYFSVLYIVSIIRHDYIFLVCFSIYLIYVACILIYAAWLNSDDCLSIFYRSQNLDEPEDIRYYNIEYQPHVIRSA